MLTKSYDANPKQGKWCYGRKFLPSGCMTYSTLEVCRLFTRSRSRKRHHYDKAKFRRLFGVIITSSLRHVSAGMESISWRIYELIVQAIWKQYFWIKIKTRPDHGFAQVTTSELLTHDLFGGLESKSQQNKCLQDLSYEPNTSLVNGSQIIFTARPSLLSLEDLPFYP